MSVQVLPPIPLKGLAYAPVLESEDREDAVITKYSYEALQNGDFDKVPVLLGFNSEEGVRFDGKYWVLSFFCLNSLYKLL